MGENFQRVPDADFGDLCLEKTDGQQRVAISASWPGELVLVNHGHHVINRPIHAQ
jgi:hypothetical protein